MRDVPAAMDAIWRSGEFYGSQRPMARVTVMHPRMSLHDLSFPASVKYDSNGNPLPSTTKIEQTYATLHFNNEATPRELPNVQSVQWQRSIDSDVGQCTISFYNTSPLPVGQAPTRDLDRPGYYTFNRGSTTYSGRWGHTTNEWQNLLVPDNVLRTYEGYGFDAAEVPERDPHLVQTGVWLIDSVSYDVAGLITVECRDYARLLLDQLVFHPVVPSDFYPLHFKAVDKVSGYIEGKTYRTKIIMPNGQATQVEYAPNPAVSQPVTSAGGTNVPVSPTALSLRFHDSSNTPSPIFGGAKAAAISVRGHTGAHAFDGSEATYWLSIGNDSPGRSYAFEWIQGVLSNQTLTQVRFRPMGSNYTAYISVHDGKKWISHNAGDVIAYRRGSISDQKSNIPFCEYVRCDDGDREYTVTLRKPIPNARYLRITLHNLQKLGSGDPQHPHPHVSGTYRGALRSMRAYGYSRNAQPASKATRARPDVARTERPTPRSPFIAGVRDSFNRKTLPTAGLGRADGTNDAWQIYHHNPSLTRLGRPAVIAPGEYSWIANGTAAVRVRKGLHDGTAGARTWAWVNLEYRHQLAEVTLTQAPGGIDAFEWLIALRIDFADIAAGNARDLRGLAVRILANGAMRVERWDRGTSTVLHTFATPVGVSMQGQRVRLRLDESTLQIWHRSSAIASSVAWGTPRYSFTDDVLQGGGGGIGFGSAYWAPAFENFAANALLKPGVFDSFSRSNAPSLGSATETRHLWRISGRAPGVSPAVASWAVRGEQAVLTGNATQPLFALANLGNLSQNVSARFHLTEPRTMHLALRASDANRFLRVDYRSGDGRVQLWRILGGREGPELLHETFVPDAQLLDDRVTLSASLRDTAISVSVDTTTALNIDDLRTGHPLFGSYVGFGASLEGVRVGQFQASVPKMPGAAPGTEEDPNSVIFWDETYVPAHIEPGAGAKPGTYEDYTDLVKLACAWAGLYWPRDATLRLSDASTVVVDPVQGDPILGREGVGRVWGDFELSGTAGTKAELTMDLFDKKTLMDMVLYVREILGFIFYVDETGGAIWRSPNIYSVGNNVAAFSPNPGRTSAMVEIDEKQTLINLTVALSSQNVRERVFISTTDGKTGAVATGWNPNDIGLRRVGGWTDQNFASAEECQVMADMITLRQLFTYRTDSLTVPGYPRIQIDDQVRIFEASTSEGYIHYVKGVNSSLNLEDGQWTYQLSTHWLGEQPFERWVFDPALLSQETQDYLKATRLENDGDTAIEVPRGTPLPEVERMLIIVDGSDLPYGVGAGNGQDFPSQLVSELNKTSTAVVTPRNVAQRGATTPTLIGTAAARVDARRSAQHTYNIVVISEGTNHLASGPSTAALEAQLSEMQQDATVLAARITLEKNHALKARLQAQYAALNQKIAAKQAEIAAVGIDEQEAHQALRTYCLARRTAGLKVIVTTVLPRQDAAGSAGFETKRTLLNSLIRSRWQEYADEMADIAGDARIGGPAAPRDGRYFASNKVHLRNAGHQVVTQVVAAAIERLVVAIKAAEDS